MYSSGNGRSSVEERFWSKVDRSGGPEACWPWKGKPDSDSYGRFYGFPGEVRAHRVALTLTLGRPIGDGLDALHRCDNRPCCNPGHLFEGTNGENCSDRHAKGRDASHGGELNGRHVLTAEDVQRIRERMRSVPRNSRRAWYERLAKEYGVSSDCIAAAATGKTWAHLEEAPHAD